MFIKHENESREESMFSTAVSADTQEAGECYSIYTGLEKIIYIAL